MTDFRKLLDTLESFNNDELMEVNDSFDLEINDELLIETGIVGFTEDGVILEADEKTLELLLSNGALLNEETDWSKYDEPTVDRIKQGKTPPVDRTDYDLPPGMRNDVKGKTGPELRREKLKKMGSLPAYPKIPGGMRTVGGKIKGPGAIDVRVGSKVVERTIDKDVAEGRLGKSSVPGKQSNVLSKTLAQIKKMLSDGEWEAEDDIKNVKPGSHVTLRSTKTKEKKAYLIKESVAEGSDYTPPKLGTVKANLMHTKEPTVQVQVFKHNTLRGDSYWVTKEVKRFKTMDQARAYIDRINKQGVAEDNDTVYKDWRKNVGTDYDTTLKLVDKDYNPNAPRNREDELAKMNKKLKGVAEGAPELLKKEMPLHRHAEKLLAQNGVSKDDPDYHHHLGNTIKHLRQFGNIDLINKSDKQGVAEGSEQDFKVGNKVRFKNRTQPAQYMTITDIDRNMFDTKIKLDLVSGWWNPGSLVHYEKQGVAEGQLGTSSTDSDSLAEIKHLSGLSEGSREGVISSVTNRILRQHVDLLSTYGPEKVLAAIEDQAEGLDDLEEIGSSDVSIWVDQVRKSLERGAYDHLKENNSSDEARKRKILDMIKMQKAMGNDKAVAELEGILKKEFPEVEMALENKDKDEHSLNVGVEAYGVRGMNSKPWRKTFKSQQSFEQWLEQTAGDVEVQGTREVNLNDMFKEGKAEKSKLDLARTLYAQTYAKNAKTVNQAKEAEKTAYAAVEKKYGSEVLSALKKHHSSNRQGVAEGEQIYEANAFQTIASHFKQHVKTNYGLKDANYENQVGQHMHWITPKGNSPLDHASIIDAAKKLDPKAQASIENQTNKLGPAYGDSEGVLHNTILTIRGQYKNKPFELTHSNSSWEPSEYARSRGMQPKNYAGVLKLSIHKNELSRAGIDQGLSGGSGGPGSPYKSVNEAEYQGRKVSLGKPFLTPDGPKKRSVYVKNAKGNVVKVNFGDKKMRIKKSSPSHRKSFRARHKCSSPGPRWKARFWSCRAW